MEEVAGSGNWGCWGCCDGFVRDLVETAVKESLSKMASGSIPLGSTVVVVVLKVKNISYPI